MQDNIHPQYGFVVFKDTSSDFEFLSKSTLESKETVKWKDGNYIMNIQATSCIYD